MASVVWFSAAWCEYRGFKDRENDRWVPFCTLPKLSYRISYEIPTIKATNKVWTLVQLHSESWALSKRKHVTRSVRLYIACIYISYTPYTCPTICHIDMSVLLGLYLTLSTKRHPGREQHIRACSNSYILHCNRKASQAYVWCMWNTLHDCIQLTLH